MNLLGSCIVPQYKFAVLFSSAATVSQNKLTTVNSRYSKELIRTSIHFNTINMCMMDFVVDVVDDVHVVTCM